MLDRDVVDLEYGTNLKIIYKNRPRTGLGARKVGGGVSIVYDKSKCNFRERRIVGNNFELVVAVGKIGKIARPAAVFCVYIEPRMRVAELERLNELINHEILQLKAKGDPLLFVGGDLNRKSILPAVEDFPDLSQINHQPTRGTACLDVIFSNSACLTDELLPPLENLAGTSSDHLCVLFSGRERHARNFVWTRKTTRRHSQQAVDMFGHELDRIDWDSLLPASLGPDEMVAKFEAVTSGMVDRLFPLRSVRCRDNEEPWMTEGIRRISKLKQRVFRREKKSRLWCALRDRAAKLVDASKKNYVDTVASSGTSSRSYYKAVKAVGTKNKQTSWSVADLFPDKSEAQAGEEAAKYFTQITDLFDPLEPTEAAVPPREPVSLQQVEALLKSAKKPSSQVPGDVLPRLVKAHHKRLAPAAMRIFNSVFRTGKWPSAWKTETVVVIPKVPNPSSLSECRNISCTAFLSKVLESVILADLRHSVPEDAIQYGGIRGSSVDHLLVDLLDDVMDPLDKGRPVTVMGIDYEKAFNRLDHRECLDQLRRLGAAEHSVHLVRSFLTGRSMQVKVGNSISSKRILKGGSPQGSILGCYLYCATTRQINPANNPPPLPPRDVTAPPARTDAETNIPDATPPAAVERGMALLEREAADLMDLGDDSSDDSFQTALGDPPGEDDLDDMWAWPAVLLSMFKYVDDTTTVEAMDPVDGIRHVSGNNPTEVFPADGSRTAMEGISTKAASIGMRVNASKTQILCVSPSTGYKSMTSFSLASGETLQSTSSIKLLGFVLSHDMNMQPQVDMMLRKFRARFWMLIHLRRTGIAGTQLFRLYVALLRPVLEVNAVIFHPMLTIAQSEAIERLQKLVVRLCFGPYTSYSAAINNRGITSLKDRRQAAIVRFTAKAMSNPKFADRWFNRREDVETDLRARRPYLVKRANTARYMKSPLLNIQKTANEMMMRTANT